MLNPKDAMAAIKIKLEHADKLIKECEAIARESKVDFYVTSPCGRSEEFDGTGCFTDEGQPTGWDHSQC